MADRNYPMASEQPKQRIDILGAQRAQNIADAAQGAGTFKGDLVADERHRAIMEEQEAIRRAMALKMMAMGQQEPQPMDSMNLPLTQAQAIPNMNLPLTAEQGKAKRGAVLKKYASLK